ncbi:MAG: helix-hairpin-helix domain-containing protein [Candidatus Woesebacteria bacterium]|jgi:DNA polymerase (family 10)
MKIHNNMTNLEIVELLKAVASAYEIKDEEKNRFKIIAYNRAADAVEHLSSEAKDLWDEGKLEEIPGVGKSIANHLDEIFKKGKSTHFKKVMKGLPAATYDLISIPGIGPKTAEKLTKKFGKRIGKKTSIKDLERLAKKGEIAKLEGMGEDSQEAILKAIKDTKGKTKRLLLPYAQNTADEIIDWLQKSKDVKRSDTLGSLRRKASTVGDVDVAVASDNPSKVIKHFCSYPKKTRVLEKGKRDASIILPGGKQVDLKIQSPNSYGALLQHFTGSKHHNIALREYANKKGLSLSEYGIKKRKTKSKKTMKFSDEKSFYNYLKLKWIPPELREDNGEIEAAVNNNLPKLIKEKDVRADLQIHSDFDIETSHDVGESSMEAIIEKADSLGYEYIAFTEHNPSKSRHSKSQITDIIKRKKEKVDKLSEKLKKDNYSNIKRVFNSLEIDILPSGKLPVPMEGLRFLDFALVSIHSSFKKTRKQMTDRVISALSHEKVKIFAHPTARKLNTREGVELDWETIFDYCVNNDKWLEINADPMRLDLPDFLVKDAVTNNVILTLGTDAHHKDMLDNMKYGVYVARRGWAQKENVVNTKSLDEFEKLLK